MTPERRALVFFFALAAACLSGIAAATGGSLDRQILLNFPRNAILNEAALSLTALGSSPLLILFTLIAALFLVLEGKLRPAAVIAAAYPGAEIFSQLLKHLINRPRPHIVPHLVHVSDASLPSGHAMLSAAVYLTFGIHLARARPRRRVFFLSAAILLTVIVGLTRLDLGVHWPTDVLAGWSLGALWAFLLSFADE